MSIKRYKLEQIVALLRQIEVGIANGKTTPKSGTVVMETVLETKALTILQFVHGLRATLHTTFEEGAWAAWLYDLLKPHVTKIVACDPRKNASMKEGNRNDKMDARRLAELLRLGRVVSQRTLGPLGPPEKAIGHESPIEPWLALDHRSALLVSEQKGFVANRR